ncbi:hypothetical protein A4D02_06715 [Niastella koreensis]|uniref:Uncharacterized protein n=2 Tax=Niastella koreensis TaxID=354356 RepID=G8TH80_NIAKG|nr:hypothetical protein [Niastella koreensis]AEW01690.1 hypothetical protein Niako_5455 [Niastella koreensis GR20-10]OQP48403.1 hypothetical protein A4D02_06715 [Niastella koreensis]
MNPTVSRLTCVLLMSTSLQSVARQTIYLANVNLSNKFGCIDLQGKEVIPLISTKKANWL